MNRIFTFAHRYLAWVVLAAVAFQFFLAGIGVFGAGSLDPHRYNGGLILLGSLLLTLIALAGRAGRKTLGGSAALFGLTVVQILLVWGREISPYISALHPLNALALLYFSYALAYGRLRAELLAVEVKPVEALPLGKTSHA